MMNRDKNNANDKETEEECRMPEYYVCIHCGKHFYILDNWLGHQWRCPTERIHMVFAKE